MNKEQQALDELRDLVHSELDGTKMLDEYLKHCDTLQKLVDKQSNPTLDECIKEWKDDGFKFEKIFCYSLINKKKGVEIFFDNESTGIWCHIKGGLTLKQLIRLIKIFKALGWEVEDETKRNDNRLY